MQENTDIYVSVRDPATMETRTYPAFYVQGTKGDGNGYQLYLKESSLPKGSIHISVIVDNENGATCVVSQDTNENQEGE